MTKKQAIREEMRKAEDALIYNEHHELAIKNAILLDFVYLAAANVRSDGTYNNCREALEQKAKQVLDKIGL